MSDEFVIEEAIGDDPIKVTLRAHELPFGRPRHGAAFALGGPVNRELIYLDGRISPIVHAKQPQFSPTHLRGHFRDRFTENAGDAWAFVKQLENIRHRMRPLKLTWWILTWSAFMEFGEFPVEGTGDFEYEMRFDVLAGPTTDTAPPDRDRVMNMTTAPADLTAEVQALIAQDRINMIGFTLLHTVAVALDDTFANIDAALSNVQDAAAAFEAAPARADAEAKTLIGKCTEAASRCQDLQDQLNGFSASSLSSSASDLSSSAAAIGNVMASNTSDAQNAYWAWLTQTVLDMTTTKDALRTIQFTARQRINASTQIYVVKDGDTLESIATSELGSAAQAQQLGYTQADLQRGRKIRIPAKVG